MLVLSRTGSFYISSRYADGRYKPQLDAALNGQNNILGFYGSIIGDTAIVYFQRPIGSEETRDISLQYDRYLQFARGRLSNSRDISYHSYRAVSDNQFLFYCGESSVYMYYLNYMYFVLRMFAANIWHFGTSSFSF